LPIWGYFFEKVLADKTLGITKEAKFVQPESMKVESFMDYENFADRYRNEPDAENPDAGNGTSSDYGDLNLTPDPTLGPESQLTEEQKVLQEAKKQEEKKPDTKKDPIKPAATDNSKTKDSTKKKWWPFKKKDN
jgi:penicillin-binding protein 1A